MRSDLESNRSRDLNIISGNFGTRRIRAQGNINLNELLPNTVIDPNGADRIVTLCKPAEGVFCLLTNNGIANSLTIRSQAGATIDTLQPGDGQFFYSDGILWYATGLTASDWHVFGPAGPPHSTGLVPDPGPVAGLQRVLYDDGTWKSISVGGPTDAYKQISDGTNIAIAQGLSQLRLRSSDGSLGIAVTENDPTFGDVANLIANPANINHNALLNYVPDQHIAHSSVSILAGAGLTGGGTIAATRTLAIDLNGLAVAAPLLTDSAPFYSTSAAGPRKHTFAVLNGILDHNALLNYAVNRHIDHSAVTITAGNGLSGGGDITAPRTLSLDINGLAVDVPAVGDFIPFFDISQSDLNKTSFATLNGILDHNTLLNYVADQHVAHSSVSIIAGAGLAGGGTIAASRTLSLVAPAAAVLGGVFSNAGVANQWIKSINTDGTVTLSQPAFSNISGIITSAQMPLFTSVAAGIVPASGGGTVNFLRADGNWAGVGSASITPPAPAVLGGVFSNVGAASKWIKSINTDGSVTLTQPAFTDVSGSVAATQMPALTGDVTTTAGATVATIPAGTITLAKMANLAANSVIGNNTGSPAVPIALSKAQLTAMINAFTTALSGAVPASGGGTTNFLRADGTWTAPAGGGGGATLTVSDTPPGSPVDGSLWWESDSGRLFVRYNDGNSSQWVIAMPQFDGTSAVRWDMVQALTTAQQQQARQNIYAAPLDALAYSGMQMNGGMEINQGPLSASTTNGAFVCDGWNLAVAGLAVSAGQTTSPGSFLGVANGLLGISVTTASPSLAATDMCHIGQTIEGTRFARMGWGTPSARPLTIGFWTCHVRPGMYSAAVRNASGTRSYAFTYPQSVASTAEYHTVTIPGDTAGVWPTDTGGGALVGFTMACGSTYTAPLTNTWVAGNYVAAPGQINAVAATSDGFYITGVVVLPGGEAPIASRAPFIMRPFEQELRLCKRYYEKTYPYADPPGKAYGDASGGGPLINYGQFSPSIGYVPLMWRYEVEKRAVPTYLNFYSPHSGQVSAGRFANASVDVAMNVLSNAGTCAIGTCGGNALPFGDYFTAHATADARI